MKKWLTVLLTGAFVVSAALTASAAVPAPDVQANQGIVGYSWHNFDTDITGASGLPKFKANEFYGTIGLSHDWAVNLDYFKTSSKTIAGVSSSSKCMQYDVQYRVQPNLAVMLGSSKTTVTIANDYSKTNMYLGVAYNQPFEKNFNGYVSVKAGSKLLDWTAGVTYDVAKNVALDLNYRYQKTKDFTTPIGSEDLTVKGIGLGLAYKF